MKHGLTSTRTYVFDNESPEKWAVLLQIWHDKLQPRDEAEACIVLDIAHAQWGLRRCRTYESGLMNFEMEEQAERLAALYEEVDEGVRQASAFKALADNSRSLDLLHRYETRHRRAFERGLSALAKLRAMAPAPPPEKASWPNEPTNAPAPSQPEENTEPAPNREILQNESSDALSGPSPEIGPVAAPVPAGPRNDVLQNESAALAALPQRDCAAHRDSGMRKEENNGVPGQT